MWCSGSIAHPTLQVLFTNLACSKRFGSLRSGAPQPEALRDREHAPYLSWLDWGLQVSRVGLVICTILHMHLYRTHIIAHPLHSKVAKAPAYGAACIMAALSPRLAALRIPYTCTAYLSTVGCLTLKPTVIAPSLCPNLHLCCKSTSLAGGGSKSAVC